MILDQIGEMLGRIYDVALDESGWPALLGELAGRFNCVFADHFERAEDYSSFAGVQFGLDEDDYQDVFLGFWAKRNVWATRRPVKRAGEIVVTRDMTPVADLMASEMYSEYLAPRGLHEGLRLDLWAGDGTMEDISLLRPWSAGPYDDAELGLARALLPHFQRSAAVSRTLRRAGQLARAGLAALDHLHTAVLVLDRMGRVLHANGAALSLLAAHDGLALTASGLTGATMPATRLLQAALDGAAGRPGAAGRSGALRLPRPSGGPSLALTALPLRPDSAAPWLDLPGAPRVLVCVTDPASGADLRRGHLTALFGLTPAEAVLAEELMAGRELREIAERSDRSVHTVRSQLARLMAKTETGRQADLVRLLARLPAAGREDG